MNPAIDYSDEALDVALSNFLVARDTLNQIKELRRMAANRLRINANQKDALTNQVVEEVNEVAPLNFDYEPVQPIEADED
jgi:hypothetical protein